MSNKNKIADAVDSTMRNLGIKGKDDDFWDGYKKTF